MENKNVLYIDYLDSYLDVLSSKFPRWVRKLCYLFLKFIGFVKVEDNVVCLMCLEGDYLNERMIRNLNKVLLKCNIRNLVLADRLLKNEEFVSILDGDFYLLNGKWLYKFIMVDILSKISNIQNKELNKYEVTILCNNLSEVVTDNIKLISGKCKILNVLTNNINDFEYLEKQLYQEFGALLNVSSNFNKVCLFSDVIVNVDFGIDYLKRCVFRKGSVLVQCTKEKFENKYGVMIADYNLDFHMRYLDFFQKKSHFRPELLYESLIYYNTSFLGIRDILKRDNISIRSFEGLHGKIDFREIKNVNKL